MGSGHGIEEQVAAIVGTDTVRIPAQNNECHQMGIQAIQGPSTRGGVTVIDTVVDGGWVK